jgi:beta-exotoxin I transport system permease protein
VKRLVLADLLVRYRMLLGVALGSAAFLMLFSGTYEALGGAATINSFMSTTDQTSFFSAFTGSRGSPFIEGPLQYLAFGFNHPFFLVITMSVGVGIGAGAVAGDVESGRAELLYTRAIHRTRIYDARLGLWVVAQIAVVLMAVVGAYLGSFLSTDVRDADLSRIFLVAAQYLPLALLAGAIAFCASAFRSTKGSAIGIAVSVLIASYLANFTALLWSPAEFLRWFTPFGYYEPLSAVEGLNWSHVVVLSVASVLLVAVGRWRLGRRDLN